MAQQAVPNAIGHIEESLAQLIRSSNFVMTMPPFPNFRSNSPNDYFLNFSYALSGILDS